jgi:hypothetical protein
MTSGIRLTKRAALARLDALREVVEGEELSKIHALAALQTLVEYIHDKDIADAIDAIPM